VGVLAGHGHNKPVFNLSGIAVDGRSGARPMHPGEQTAEAQFQKTCANAICTQTLNPTHSLYSSFSSPSTLSWIGHKVSTLCVTKTRSKVSLEMKGKYKQN